MIRERARAGMITAAAFFVLIGCAKSKVAVETSGHSPKSWKGAYLTAPESWEKMKRAGYAELRFGLSGRVQIVVRDREFTDLLWIGKARVLDGLDHELTIQCESISIFARVDGMHRQILSRTFAGVESKPHAISKEWEKKRLAFEKNSEILRTAIPSAWRECSGESAVLRREIDEGETRLVADGGVRFAHPLSDEYRVAVDRAPRPTGDLEEWAAAERWHLSPQSTILTDTRNSILPLPQTHRYFLLPKLKLASDFRIDGAVEITIAWERGTRPTWSGKDRKLPISVREAMDTARWETPAPLRARIVSIEDGEEADIAIAGQSPEKSPALTIKSHDLAEVFCRENGKYRLSITYTSPSLLGSDEELVQIVEFEANSGEFLRAGEPAWRIEKK